MLDFTVQAHDGRFAIPFDLITATAGLQDHLGQKHPQARCAVLDGWPEVIDKAKVGPGVPNDGHRGDELGGADAVVDARGAALGRNDDVEHDTAHADERGQREPPQHRGPRQGLAVAARAPCGDDRGRR